MVRHQTLIVTGETQLMGEVSMSSVPTAIQDFVRTTTDHSQLVETIAALEQRIAALDLKVEALATAVWPRIVALEAKFANF